MTDSHPSVPPGDPLGPPQAPRRQGRTGRRLVIFGGIIVALVVLATFLNATTDLKQPLIDLVRPPSSVNPGSSNSTGALVLSVTCTLDPKTPAPGVTATLTYAITSNRDVKVGLSADISRDVDEKGNDDDTAYATGSGDVESYQIHVGKNPPKSRPVMIPTNLPPGDYTVSAEVWPANKIDDDGVDTYDDDDCAAFTVN
jgi:hypothetical protein